MPRRLAPPDPLQRSLFDAPVDSLVDAPAGDVPHATAAAPPAAAGEPGAGGVFRHPRAQRELRLQGQLVAYEMRRARRRSIGFVVGAEGLTVSAPRWVGVREIEAALHDKSGWILRKLHEQRERALRLQRERVAWGDGAGLPFLGQTLVLLVDPRTTGVVLDADSPGLPGVPCRLLRVGLPHGAAPEQMRDAVQGWLQRQARRIFEERIAIYAPRLGVRVRRLGLSSAATRWGSASADGSVRLNWRLVHFALPIVDYVVVHELAHLREMNHGPAFWEVVRSVIPDVDAARGALRDGQVPVLD